MIDKLASNYWSGAIEMQVLIIGETSRDLAQISQMALARGARLLQTDNIYIALTKLRADRSVDLVFCDIQKGAMEFVKLLNDERIGIPIIVYGPVSEATAAIEILRCGAREYLQVPADAAMISAFFECLTVETHPLIASDPIMLATMRRADQIAPSEASVLISGESGTGKEILARYIHRRSRRAGGPFVALNCSAIPDGLLESELFGHEKGAFTGALAKRLGKFEAAESGTLLLDEISEMDVRLQAKLLRAVQEREIDRIGGLGPVKINVRILATTNRDLASEVSGGRFREDLFFRLNVVSLKIPPLRERRQDIGVLADRFAKRYSEVNGVRLRALSAEAAAKLMANWWRGNVRELENVMHRAVLIAQGAEIGADDIEFEENSLRPTGTGSSIGDTAGLVGRRVEDVERELILTTLRHTLGNRTHAALMLGISIRTLRNKLRDYSAAGEPVIPPAVMGAA